MMPRIDKIHTMLDSLPQHSQVSYDWYCIAGSAIPAHGAGLAETRRGKMSDPSFTKLSTLHEAYAYCLRQARSHYENFPVASALLPRAQRLALGAVYAFARHADDLADEGGLPPEDRLVALDKWEEQLSDALAGSHHHPVSWALADAIGRYDIPIQLFHDLIAAFRSDIGRHSFQDFAELLGYCRLSANPVGRIVLSVFHDTDPDHLDWSDCVCTALQLTNFWQDIEIDLQKGRIYLPLEDLDRFRYTPLDLQTRVEDDRFQALLRFQVDRTRSLFFRGAPLITAAPRSVRRQLAMTWLGGMRILHLIERADFKVLRSRPKLRARHILPIIVGGVFFRRKWTVQQQP
jgi:squalene synthase HpnC